MRKENKLIRELWPPVRMNLGHLLDLRFVSSLAEEVIKMYVWHWDGVEKMS